MPGLFYATNTYALNSAPEVEVVGSKKTVRYAYQKLFVDGELMAQDLQMVNGKSYWGNGHTALFEDYYVNNHFFKPQDIKNTMRTLFGIYQSAYHNNALVYIDV